jgi:hypothetical protein
MLLQLLDTAKKVLGMFLQLVGGLLLAHGFKAYEAV